MKRRDAGPYNGGSKPPPYTNPVAPTKKTREDAVPYMGAYALLFVRLCFTCTLRAVAVILYYCAGAGGCDFVAFGY